MTNQPVPERRRPAPPQQEPRKRSLLVPILLVGVLVAFFVFVFVIASAFFLFMPTREVATVQNKSVLLLDLRQGAPETAPLSPFTLFTNEREAVFHDHIDAVRAASADDRVSGVLLYLGPGLGWAQAQELRSALQTFRERGKWVVSYGDTWEELEYYLASVADRVLMVPDSMLMLNGLRARTSFYADLLDKYGIGVHVEAHGEYKSFADSWRNTEMSEYHREATRVLLQRFEQTFSEAVSETRGISVADLQQALEKTVHQTSEALELGLLDGVSYYDQLRGELAGQLDLDDPDRVHFVPTVDYVSRLSSGGRSAIAVIYASGTIQSGSGRQDLFGGNVIADREFLEDLRAARRDSRVKAIVLRIDSPGGSMLASDIMWREIRRTVASGKPVIASMGNVAASGGYYMAMACDEIVALPTTITGSIGVVTMKIDLAGLYTKNDVYVDVVKTHESADLYDEYRGLTPDEIEMLSSRTRQSYQNFVKKAAESRGLAFEELDRVARGRVWSGADAAERRLVDVLGGLNTAIERAAAKVNLSNYDIIRYPLRETYFGFLEENDLPITRARNTAFSRFIPHELRLLAGFAAPDGRPFPITLAIEPYHLRID